MIIKELRICNFLVFPGEQVLEFPTEQDTNLIVILAPNNTGKTNVIRALKFLFYGHLPDCSDLTAYRLIYDGARGATRIGAEVSGWVEVRLELDGEELTLRRTVKTRRQSKDQFTTAEVMFTKVLREGKLRLILDSDGIYQAKIRTMVPEQLFDAFYFKGEPLDGKLLGGVGAIRASLASFLHEDRWGEVEEAAEAVRQQYTRDLGRLNARNDEYNELLGEEDLVRNYLLKEQEKLRKAKQDLEEATAQFNDATSRLQELGSGSEAEKLVAQLRDARAKLDAAKRARERADAEIARLVGASRGIPFLLGALPSARRILAQLQEENILPSDVSERFVNRVLSTRCCICGREHDEQTRKAWTQYKEKTLSVDLNRGLSDLLSAVQDDHMNSYARQSQETAKRLKAAMEARGKALEYVAKNEVAGADIEKRLQNSPIEEIRALTQQVRQEANSREQLNGEIARLEDSINLTQKNLRNLKEKLEKARPPGAMAQKEKAIQAARMRAEKLRLLIQQSREVLNRSFHELLQQSVSEYYDRAAYDGSKARINRATLLPAIEANGQVHGNLGGGQSQLLALAYIVSLSRLRKSLHSQMKALGVGFGKVDDQSFFLDSPFNHVSQHYAHAVARFLEGNARQVVLLLARHQWNLVREVLEEARPHILVFEPRTFKEDIPARRARMPCGRRIVNVGTGAPDAMRDTWCLGAGCIRAGKRERCRGSCAGRIRSGSSR